MSNFRIAVCEDDNTSREFESKLIYEWAETNGINICVDSYTSAENFLFESEDKLEYDLVILDIQMGKMNGFELAKVLRKRGFSGALIFLTGITDYAIEGYEVGAVRYLLKPIKEKELYKTLSLVYEGMATQQKEVFLLQIGNDITKIEYSNIIYVEARGHYVHLCAKNHNGIFEKEWKSSFSSVSTDFEEHNFFCLRRGLLVNLEHVSKINRSECILDNDEIIPVARGKYQELNEAFIKHYKDDTGGLDF